MMRLRPLFIALTVTAATFALASGLLQYAEGRGKALSSDGRRASFQFNVRKLTSGPNTSKSGTALYEIADRETLDGVRIYMRELQEITVDGNLARFEGPGSIRFRTVRGVVERVGRVYGFARDNRKPTGPIEPRDRIGVRFIASVGDLTYGYEGNVMEGDAAVGRREQP
jgi:hypothetical protein